MNEETFYQGPGQLATVTLLKDSAYILLGAVLAYLVSYLPVTVFGFAIGAYYMWLWLIPMLIGALMLGYHFILENNKKYLITSNKIQCESGIVGKNIEIIELYKVIDLNYQSLFGRGQIRIYSTDPSANESTGSKAKASGGGAALYAMSLPNARTVFEQLQKALPAARERSKVGMRMDINH